MLTEIPLDDGWAGHALVDIERAAGVRIAYITRFGEGMLPRPDSAYQQGDSVHVMMRTDDVADVTRILSRPPRTEDDEVEYRTDANMDWLRSATTRAARGSETPSLPDPRQLFGRQRPNPKEK